MVGGEEVRNKSAEIIRREGEEIHPVACADSVAAPQLTGHVFCELKENDDSVDIDPVEGGVVDDDSSPGEDSWDCASTCAAVGTISIGRLRSG